MKKFFNISQKDGRPLWATLLSVLVGVLLVVAFITAINERTLKKKRMQEALEASNKIFAALTVSALETGNRRREEDDGFFSGHASTFKIDFSRGEQHCHPAGIRLKGILCLI